MTYEQTLRRLAETHPNLVVMTAENRATIRGLPEPLGDRLIDVGIAEMTLVGSAAGLALRGRLPVAHALATFLVYRAYEFVRDDVGMAQLPVKLVGFVPGFLSEANGPTHQAIEDVALMRMVPNMRVWCPADEAELLAGLPHIVADPSPWYIRYNQSKPVVSHTEPFEIGKAEVWGQGHDVVLATYGLLLGEASRARDILADAGLSVGLINLRTLSPLDTDALMSAARGTRLLVTVEDHLQVGGLFSAVGELFLEQGEQPCAVEAIALKNRWFKPALLPDVLRYEGFTGEQIAERIQKRLAEAAA